MNIIEKLREMHRLNIAVKEALDTLPSAVCYFVPNGTIKLCNTAMYDFYRKITGKDLQSFAELTEALENCGASNGIIREGNVFLFPDGRAWQYSAEEIRTAAGRNYIQVVFSDVTELYEKHRELKRQSEEMNKMYADLKLMSGQLLEITREQEILNMKARLHDQMNMGITAIRQILRQDTTSGENAAAVAQFRRAIWVLQEENAYPQDELSEFIRDAQVAGVQVNLCGILPEEQEIRNLLIAVMREACVNAARHADAHVLNIASELTEYTAVLRITNDGRPPKQKIVPRGGLADLGRRIIQIGGAWEIRSLPEFELTVSLPVSRRYKREEAER